MPWPLLSCTFFVNPILLLLTVPMTPLRHSQLNHSNRVTPTDAEEFTSSSLTAGQPLSGEDLRAPHRVDFITKLELNKVPNKGLLPLFLSKAVLTGGS